MSIAVEVATTDEAWIAAHSSGRVEERVVVPGCHEVSRHTFMGREWVNYDLPAGVEMPADWRAMGAPSAAGALSAPAIWVR